jgi:prophage tail gpP-like protein
MNPNLLQELTVRIIREQELVIGPLAWIEAAKVTGLSVIDQRAGTILFTEADQGSVIDKLVAQYEKLFGRASHEVSRDAVKSLLANVPREEIPTSLRP